jgi:RNA polymerase subunit RPABC4/transcription elongation factor Spt4
MRYKTFTRLLIKLMGIYFLLGGLVSLAASVVFLLIVVGEYSSYGGISMIAYPASWGVSSLVSIALGLFLLLASNWIVDRLIPSNRPYCPNCGYELTGNTREQCPECGVDVQGMGLAASE